MNRSGSKPIAIRAWEALNKHFSRGTDVGRYLLSRVEPFAKRAQRKLDRPAPSTKQVEFRKLREDADEVFSLYIRWRDTKEVVTMGVHGRAGYCCTCNKLKYYANLQCGHWQSRKHWGTRWEEDNSHAQCEWCNDPRRGGGQMAKHEEMIVATRGAAVRDRILAYVKLRAKKPSVMALQITIDHFRMKLEKEKAR